MDATHAELLLIELRGDAPLVRTKFYYEGYMIGTLGYIAGVDGPYIQVMLTNGGEPLLLRPSEVENV